MQRKLFNPRQWKKKKTTNKPGPVLPHNDGLLLRRDANAQHESIQDVVFVPDAAQSSEETWKMGPSFWPDELPDKFRIYTFDYELGCTNLKGLLRSEGVKDIATRLLLDLQSLTAELAEGSRGPIFVAHGYGGLICEQAYLLSNELKGERVEMDGLILFGTPHGRAGLAQWALIAAKKLQIRCADTPSKQDWSGELQTNLDQIADMQRTFRMLDPGLRLSIYYTLVPRTKKNLRISPDWATLPGADVTPIYAHHYQMTQFETKECLEFKKLVSLLDGKLSYRITLPALKRMWETSRQGPPECADAHQEPTAQPASKLVEVLEPQIQSTPDDVSTPGLV